MSNVNTTFTSDDKDVINALKNMQKEMQRLRDENKKLKEETKQAANEAKKKHKEAADEAARAKREQRELSATVMGSIAPYTSVAAAAALVTAELNSQLELQKELAKFHRTAAAAQAGFLVNLGFVSKEERGQALARVSQISKQTGVSEMTVFDAASSAVSAKGALSTNAAMDAVQMAAQLTPDNPSSIVATSGALLDVASLTKSSDPLENLGFIAQLQSQARTTTVDQIAKNLIPGAIGAAAFGGSAGESAAAVAALNSAMKDQTGATAKTANISLARQLSEFLPENDTYTYDKQGRRKIDRRGTGLSTLDERIARIQSDPRLLDQFMGQAAFEQEALAPVRGLLTPGSEAAQLYSEFKPQYQLGDKAKSDAREFIAEIQGQPLQQSADFQRRAEQTAESLRLQRLEGGEQGAIYEAVNEELKAAGFGGPRRTLSEFNMRLRDSLGGMSSAEAGAQTLEHIGGELDQSTKEGKKTLDSFQEIISLLRSIDTKASRVNVDRHSE